MKVFKLIAFTMILTSMLYAVEKNITMDVEDADIKTVLRAFAAVGEVNIVTTKGVTGTVTFHIKNVPWRQALKSLLDAYGLAMIEREGIITVMTQQEFAQHRDIAELETRIFRIKYADAHKIQEVVKTMLSTRGEIKIDEATNSLVITDLGMNLFRVEELLAQLDKPHPQVLIQAKVVEVDYDAARSLGIVWGFTNTEDPNAPTSYSGKIDASVGGPRGIFDIGRLFKNANFVSAQLQMLETESKANIISQPSVVISDNEKATILSGKKVPIITKDMAGNTIVQFFDAAIKLEVTPHITPDGNITLDLHPQVSDIAGYSPAGQPIISNQEVQTKVTVKDGETVVIGGVLKEQKKSSKAGLPLLLRIPIIRHIFANDEKSQSKTELMIFVTPKIVGME